MVETRLTAADGSTFDADVVFFDPSSRARVILEVLIVIIGSDSSCECVRRTTGNHTIFTPIVMSACGAMGPSMVAFLKEVYGRAKEADKFLMSQQPALKHSWNTMMGLLHA